ncbi:MAG: four helix bundle protein [Bacteroidetes bacterium]|nr:four helix bundle protein [Bacteroidota bacterium]
MIDEVILNRNKNINRGYRKLVVWQEAIELFAFVKKKLKSLNTISYKLNAQIEDSIFSVHSNIAEGYCRRHLKENIQFNSIALASLGENYSHFFALLNSADISKEWFDEYDKLHYSLENKLINLNKSIIKKVNNGEWNKGYE